ncbi:MAG: hypothetical protein Ta2E_00510 [Mycoplasmoidaceae bacterium]|nr:MAG: hypothetical protein Ta2E_00510 [Mycoplasmoidaceae bacterium]
MEYEWNKQIISEKEKLSKLQTKAEILYTRTNQNEIAWQKAVWDEVAGEQAYGERIKRDNIKWQEIQNISYQRMV